MIGNSHMGARRAKRGILLLCGLVFSFSFALAVSAANPAQPFAPQDKVLDPNCLPSDTNCYIDQSNVVLTNATSTNFFSSLLTAVTGFFTNLTATNATTTNLYADTISFGDATSTRANLGLGYASSSNYAAIAAWGDSLTAGTGGTPYPTQLASSTGYTVYNGGVGGETSTQIKTRMLVDTAKHSWPTIIWVGRNNYTNPTQVKADIAEMVAALGHQNYLVLSILNGNYGNEYQGQSGYVTIIQLNNDLATTYGSHYVDIRTHLVSQYNSGVPQDVTDYANDTVPSSLRIDNIHLTSAGYGLVAQKIYENLSTLKTSSDGVLAFSSLSSMFASPFAIGGNTPNSGRFTSLTSNSLTTGAINASGSLYIRSTTPGVWLDESDGSQKGGYLVLDSGILQLQRRPTNFGTTSEATPFLISLLTGNAIIGLTSTSSHQIYGRLAVNTAVADRLFASTTEVSATPLTIGGGSDGGWLFLNGGNPTSRVRMQGFSATTQTVSVDPNGNSYLNGGNLSIGTTTSSDKFNVAGNIGVFSPNAIFNVRNGNVGTTLSFDFPEATSTPGEVRFFRNSSSTVGLSVRIMRGDGTNNVQTQFNSNSGSFVNAFGGNFGVGTTTPSAQLTTTGTVRFASLGSGGANLITDSLGNVTVSSDERLKNITGDYVKGLDAIIALRPIQYHWKEETGYDTSSTYTGFSAQNVQSSIPEAVSTDSSGFLTLADRPILATLVNAIKELYVKVESYFRRTEELEVELARVKAEQAEDLRRLQERVLLLEAMQGVSSSEEIQDAEDDAPAEPVNEDANQDTNEETGAETEDPVENLGEDAQDDQIEEDDILEPTNIEINEEEPLL